MLYLLGGFAILCGLLLLGYLFVNAEPARLARILKWTGIVVAGMAIVALAISGHRSPLRVFGCGTHPQNLRFCGGGGSHVRG